MCSILGSISYAFGRAVGLMGYSFGQCVAKAAREAVSPHAETRSGTDELESG